jgi:hypothetical protein
VIKVKGCLRESCHDWANRKRWKGWEIKRRFEVIQEAVCEREKGAG